mmetsp:Transcript_349/g.742  ORF Transcript_349/g.742 Transcript_349/m.742 type:complete len:275 (-) Transcript_349:9-833(-)
MVYSTCDRTSLPCSTLVFFFFMDGRRETLVHVVENIVTLGFVPLCILSVGPSDNVVRTQTARLLTVQRHSFAISEAQSLFLPDGAFFFKVIATHIQCYHGLHPFLHGLTDGLKPSNVFGIFDTAFTTQDHIHSENSILRAFSRVILLQVLGKCNPRCRRHTSFTAIVIVHETHLYLAFPPGHFNPVGRVPHNRGFIGEKEISTVVTVGRIRVIASVHIPDTLLQGGAIESGLNNVVQSGARVLDSHYEWLGEFRGQKVNVFHGKSINGEHGQKR